MTADQIVKQAETAMAAATSLRVKGAMTDSGTHGTIDMVMVKGVGCQGTVDLSDEGGMSIVTLGKTIYLKLDSTFLKAMGLGSRASRLKGKYVKTTDSNKDLAAMASFCDLNTFAHGGTSSGDTYTKGGLSTVGGQQVLSLKDNSDNSSVLVTVAAPHRVVQINGPTAADGSVTVTYDVAAHITPPPASEVVSAATVGM
ncbi:hypothetical protein ACFQZC_14740 [Streptacidiphilus monticola]